MVLLALAEGTQVQLIPDGTVVIHIALVLLMIFILNRTFFKPINRVLATRDKSKGGKSEAAQLLDQVAAKESQYNEEIRAARVKGYEAIEASRNEALDRKSTSIGIAKADLEKRTAEDAAALTSQTEEARAAIASEAQQLADKISATILRA